MRIVNSMSYYLNTVFFSALHGSCFQRFLSYFLCHKNSGVSGSKFKSLCIFGSSHEVCNNPCSFQKLLVIHSDQQWCGTLKIPLIFSEMTILKISSSGLCEIHWSISYRYPLPAFQATNITSPSELHANTDAADVTRNQRRRSWLS